jgi:hypothetical protein
MNRLYFSMRNYKFQIKSEDVRKSTGQVLTQSYIPLFEAPAGCSRRLHCCLSDPLPFHVIGLVSGYTGYKKVSYLGNGRPLIYGSHQANRRSPFFKS